MLERIIYCDAEPKRDALLRQNRRPFDQLFSKLSHPKLGTGHPLLDALLLGTAAGAAGGAGALFLNGLKNGFKFP